VNDKQGRPEPEGFDMPDTVDLASVDAAEVELIRLAAQRRITAREALYFSWMLEHRRRAIGDVTLEQRMRAIEARQRAEREEQERGEAS
jgi:hypothetical protein